MAGVILLTAMAAGGLSLWLKRRRDRINEETSQNEEHKNSEFTSGNA